MKTKITSNTQERHIVSPSVKRYIHTVVSMYPEMWRELTQVRKQLSGDLAKLSSTLKQLHGWTYTKRQEQAGREQLNRIFSQYPVPSYLKSTSKGLVLHINENDTSSQIKTKIAGFLKLVKPSKKSLITKNIIDSIGEVPLTEIHDPHLKGKINKVWTLDVSYNPALSIKDVIGRQLINDALKAKKIIPGRTRIIEATSGNTGAGLALVGGYYGLTTILVVPDKVSEEKTNRLRAFGAHVVIAPTKVAPNNPRSYYSIRDYLGNESNTWVPQQYDNLSNSKAHKLYTGPHIWKKTKGTVTAVIIPTGTCGTVSGIGQYLKSKNPKIRIIGVDSIGSILYLLKQGYKVEDVQKYSHSYTIQGFGEDFQPKNLDLSVIDHYIRVSDISGLQMTQMLMALGLFQGQSSGASYTALLEALNTGYLTKDDNVLVLFPDVGVPYRHDVYNDSWMIKNKFQIKK
jgi:cysteine synthase